ncbi:MAG: ion transporter [Methanosphaera sp.]|nr:ion transporter [Methanosphaera sp.]
MIKNEYKNLLGQVKNIIILILIVVDLIFIILSAVSNFSMHTERLLLVFDLIVCIIIFIDLIYGYKTSHKGLHEYFITDKNIITLISIMPLDLIFFRYFMIFRLLKALRILKVIRIWHLKDNNILRFFVSHRVFNILIIIFILYTAFASILLLFFDPSFSSLGDGIWFTLITSTTVGYGDITPTSVIGRAITIMTIIVGVMFVSIFTAYLSSIYDRQSFNRTREQIEDTAEKNEKDMEELKNQINRLEEKIDQLMEKNE